MLFTTDDIIASVKNRGLIPSSQKTFQTAQFLDFMNQELTNGIVPLMMRVRENYFLKPYDQTIQANIDSYDLHPRAIGMKLKNLFFIVNSQTSPIRLTMTTIDSLPEIQNPSDSGSPFAFYFLDNSIKIVPIPSSAISGTLRQYYYERRNTLVSPSDCGLITAIASNVVTISSTPSTFTTTAIYDLVKGTPGFGNLATDQTITSVSSNQMTFVSAPPSNLAVGDYVCLAQQSPIPQIPLDLFPSLTQRVMIRCLRALNDSLGSDAAEKDLKAMDEAALSQISVRADDKAKKMVSSNNISKWVMGSNWRW